MNTHLHSRTSTWHIPKHSHFAAFFVHLKNNNIRSNRSQASLAYNDAHNENCYCCPISITFCHYAEAILFMIHQKWWCSYFDQISFTQMTLPKPSRCWDLNYQSIFQETWLDSNIPLKLGDLFEFEKDGNSKVLPLFCLPACEMNPRNASSNSLFGSFANSEISRISGTIIGEFFERFCGSKDKNYTKVTGLQESREDFSTICSTQFFFHCRTNSNQHSF